MFSRLILNKLFLPVDKARDNRYYSKKLSSYITFKGE